MPVVLLKWYIHNTHQSTELLLLLLSHFYLF